MMYNDEKRVFFSIPNQIKKNVHDAFFQKIEIRFLISLNVEFWFKFDGKIESELDQFIKIINTNKPSEEFSYYFNFLDSSTPISSNHNFNVFFYPKLGLPDFFKWTKIRISLIFHPNLEPQKVEEGLWLDDGLTNGFPRLFETNASVGDSYFLIIGGFNVSYAQR